MMERIEAWLRVRDGARFKAQMDEAAASVERMGAAGKKAAGGLASASEASIVASANMRKTGLAMDASGRKMMTAGSFLSRNVTRPILAVGAASAYMAARFDQDMTLIETQAGAPRGEIAKLRGQVLGLAKDSTFGPDELAKGLFHLESIGLRGAHAMDTLKIASQGAMVGNAHLEAVTTALGSAWIANIKGGGDLRHVMAMLNATVGAGNVRMDDLVQALGTGLLPAAKNAGLGMKDVMGAMAVFTDEGYQASSAAAQFSTALHFLYNPTQKASVAMEGMGMNSTQLAKDMRKPNGLLVALRDLKKHLDTLPGGASGIAAEQTLGAILPGGRGRIMLTLINQLDRYEKKMKQITDTSSRFGKSVKQSQETPLNKLKKAWSGVQVSLVQMGDVLLPMLVPLLTQMAKYLDSIFGWFRKLPPGTQKFIVKLLAMVAVLGPLLKLIGLFTRGSGLLILGLSKLIRVARYVLLGEMPAAMAGAETAAVAGTAAGGSRLGTLFGKGFMKGFARLLGGVAIASFIAQKLHIENADPLLFLHPPNAGDPNEVKNLHKRDPRTRHHTILASTLTSGHYNDFGRLEKQLHRGDLQILNKNGIPLLPGLGLEAIERAQKLHRSLLRREHSVARNAAKGIFGNAPISFGLQRLLGAPLVPVAGLNALPTMQAIPPQWFNKLEDKRPIVVNIDGREVARAVAKDTANEKARK